MAVGVAFENTYSPTLMDRSRNIIYLRARQFKLFFEIKL